MFEKKGRVQFRAGQTGSSVEDMMDSAIDAGAEDMQELEDESIEVRNRCGNLISYAANMFPNLTPFRRLSASLPT
jgi:transcriptional/translational regulatory protein YebC/TACO1